MNNIISKRIPAGTTPVLAFAAILLSFVSAGAQFSAAPSKVNAPVPKEYLDAVQEGERAYGLPSAAGTDETDFFKKQKLQAGKDNLAIAAKEFRREANALESGWPGANIAQRGFIDGTVLSATRIAQMGATGLGKQLGVAVLDNSLKPGYFEISDDVQHLKEMLTDTAAMIEQIENSVPPDQRETKFGNFLGGSVADKLPVVNIFAMHKQAKNLKQQLPVKLANQAAHDILLAAERESKFLPDANPPVSAPNTGAAAQ